MSTVWVDPLFVAEARGEQANRVGKKNGHRWSHMWSEDEAALHAMAKLIGLRREWYQGAKPLKGGAVFMHYDLTPGRRKLAIARGAKERDLADWLREKEEPPSMADQSGKTLLKPTVAQEQASKPGITGELPGF